MSLYKDWKKYVGENPILHQILECKKASYSHQQAKAAVMKSKVPLSYYWCQGHNAFHLTRNMKGKRNRSPTKLLK